MNGNLKSLVTVFMIVALVALVPNRGGSWVPIPKYSTDPEFTIPVPWPNSTGTYRLMTTPEVIAAAEGKEPKIVAQCVTAVVVLAVGAIVVYQIIKTCNKVLPPKTGTNNSTSTNGSFSGHLNQSTESQSSGQLEYAAYIPITVPEQYTAPSFHGVAGKGIVWTINPLGMTSKTMIEPVDPAAATLTWNEYRTELSGLGLDFTGDSTGARPHYAIGGVAAPAESVPISATNRLFVIYSPSGIYATNTIYRSTDTITWTKLWTIVTPVASTPMTHVLVEHIDVDEPSTFYRIGSD